MSFIKCRRFISFSILLYPADVGLLGACSWSHKLGRDSIREVSSRLSEEAERETDPAKSLSLSSTDSEVKGKKL